MPLVKFVEDNAMDLFEVGVAKHSTCEHAFRQEEQPGFGTTNFFKAHLKSNGFTEGLTKFFGDTTSRESSREPAGFQHEDLA
jgi:hypothetical protein